VLNTIQDFNTEKARLEYTDRENVKMFEAAVVHGQVVGESAAALLEQFADSRRQWEKFAESLNIFVPGDESQSAQLAELQAIATDRLRSTRGG
jgi:hypothetical protein